MSSTSSPSAPSLVTVFSDSTQFNVKHPTQYNWTLWVKKDKTASGGSQEKNWEEAIERIVTLNSVEDFWCIFNAIPAVPAMPQNSDYFFFKESIAPKWEDPKNAPGGQISVNTVQGRLDSESFWLYSLLACVGCMFQHHEHVNGVTIQKRSRGDRIQLWLDTTDPEIVRSIEADYRSSLVASNPRDSIVLQFSSFASKMGGGGGGGGGHHGGSSGAAGGSGGHHGPSSRSSGYRRDSER